jgi:hypothetical protein
MSLAKPYDAFEHLLRSLFLPTTDRMLTLAAYCDESGTDATQDIYVVAGYTSSVAAWEEFSRLWGRMLYEFRIPYYHATDLEAYWKSKIYRHVIKDRDTLKRLQSTAFSLIQKCAPKGVAVALVKEDFLEVMTPERGTEEFYSFCAQECMRGMMFWLTHERPRPGFVNYTFECGADGWGIFAKATESFQSHPHLRVGTISRAEKKAMFPLQAADALAFEIYKEMVNGILVKKRGETRVHPFRESAKRLFREGIDTATFYDKRRLIDVFIKRLSKPERS